MLTGQRIVDAPGALLQPRLRSVTMDDLALELGVSKKTLYAHSGEIRSARGCAGR